MTPNRPKKEKGGSGPAEQPKAKKSGRPKGLKPNTKARESAPRSTTRAPRGGAIPKYDWDLIRNSYVSGTQTAEALRAEILEKYGKGATPELDTIRQRSAAENWTELRKLFNQRVNERMQQTELAAAVEVRQRQARGAIRFQEVALDALELQFGPPPKEVEGDEYLLFEWKEKQKRNLAELAPFAIARLWSMGASEERKARGLDEMDVNLSDIQTPEDLRKLSLEQLLALKAMRRKALGTDPSAATQAATLEEGAADGAGEAQGGSDTPAEAGGAG